MAQRRHIPNLFYVLVVLSGVAFSITACGYIVATYMALRGPAPHDRDDRSEDGPLSQGLLKILDEHGVELMVVELAVLAIATIGAIGTDRWWNPPRACRGSAGGIHSAGGTPRRTSES